MQINYKLLTVIIIPVLSLVLDKSDLFQMLAINFQRVYALTERKISYFFYPRIINKHM